jgi:hypothetical protein
MMPLGFNKENQKVTDGLTSIIAQLERQKLAIERALAALRETEDVAPDRASSVPAESIRGNKRSEAQKARWAAKKAAEAIPAKAARKGGMTPEGRRRLAEAMKRRWAVKRAAAKKRGPRPKKAA